MRNPTKLALFVVCLGALLSPSVCAGAALLLDDFSTGSFSLSSGGSTSASGSFATPLTDQRGASGVGLPNWTAVLVPGEVGFDVNQLNPRPGRTILTLSYWTTAGTFSILGYDAFALDFGSVVGTGEMRVTVDGSGGREVRIPITESGTIVSPFSYLDTSQSLSSLTFMTFHVSATTPNFSTTIDNIRIVPEPSTFLLLLGVAAVTLLRLVHLRRKRKPA